MKPKVIVIVQMGRPMPPVDRLADEAEIAIELAKEILKATYQYGSLVARLRGLRRPRDDGQPA